MTFLDFIVTTWQDANIESHLSNVRRAEDNSKLIIEIDARNHLGTIEAWEHAYCLDIVFLSLNPTQTHWLYAGECKSFEEAKNRITNFYKLLRQNSK